MFTHNPLPRLNIDRLDYDTGRRYLTPEGYQYESVTTWLGRISDDTWLKEWYARVGEKEATKISTRAAERGTRLHENVERYLNNTEVDISTLNMLDKSLFLPFKSHLDGHVDNIRCIEYPLYSDILKLGGSIDLCADYDGVISTIDFKTSKDRKNKADITNYFLQTTIYTVMLAERYKITTNKLVIIIALDWENKVQVFEEDPKKWIRPLMELIKKHPPKVIT